MEDTYWPVTYFATTDDKSYEIREVHLFLFSQSLHPIAIAHGAHGSNPDEALRIGGWTIFRCIHTMIIATIVHCNSCKHRTAAVEIQKHPVADFPLQVNSLRSPKPLPYHRLGWRKIFSWSLNNS